MQAVVTASDGFLFLMNKKTTQDRIKGAVL